MKGIFEKKDLGIIVKKTEGFQPFAPMFHAHAEIIYVLSGIVDVNIDGIKKSLSAGEMSITFPYSVHSYCRSDSAKTIIILFSTQSAGTFEKKLLSCRAKNPFINNGEYFLPVIEKILKYSFKHDEGKKIAGAYLSALIGEILSLLDLVDIAETDTETAQKILLYLSQHYKENLSIKSAASNLFISESYITKIFSELIGMPFRKYINILRISEAKKLLENTNMRIIDIMLECGYKNQSSFNRIFYEETGLSPKEYRKYTVSLHQIK